MRDPINKLSPRKEMIARTIATIDSLRDSSDK